MGSIVAIGGYESESQKDGVINTPIEIDKKILSLEIGRAQRLNSSHT